MSNFGGRVARVCLPPGGTDRQPVWKSKVVERGGRRYFFLSVPTMRSDTILQGLGVGPGSVTECWSFR